MTGLTAFKIEKDGKEYDYRLGKDLNLQEATAFFSKRYKIVKLWSGSRHVLGILERNNQLYFLKLSTTKGISLLTENEFIWNESFNKEIKRLESNFWVPQNYDSGYFKGLFYLITDHLDGKVLTNNLSQLEIIKIIEFIKIIEQLKNIPSGSENHQEYFLRKTKLWFENIPESARENYQVKNLLKIVEDGSKKLLEKPRHGDFAPWHLFFLKNGKLGLIDAEHAMGNGVEGYDLAYFIQRIFSVSKNPILAKKILKAAKVLELNKLKTVLAARAIGGFLDESLAPKPDYQLAKEFMEWVRQICMRYFIKTFGCAANVADSERIAAAYEDRGFSLAKNIEEADEVILNTCMVRESAENRVYGLVNNLKTKKVKIILTGCMVGMAVKDKSGKMMKLLKKRMPSVDEFLPIEEVGFDYSPIRSAGIQALVPISNGCNNYCSYCIVPFTRGPEISRPFAEIISEVKNLVKEGYEEILLIGQNVNSYGSDLIRQQCNNVTMKQCNITMVKHLGKYRIPTLFPYLLQTLCQIEGLKKIDFISSNPWDFSEELIETIVKNPQISRIIHLPVQSGDDQILKKMNRWYTRDEYLKLVANLKVEILNLKLSTDIIVGFPGETEEQFQNTVKLCKKVGFYKAYISRYSLRPGTASAKMVDDVTPIEKHHRWKILNDLINK